MNVASTCRTLLGATVLTALLAGCQNQPPVSPAVVSQQAQPQRPPMPTDAELGTPSGTFNFLPNAAIAGQEQSGLSGIGTLFYNGRRYRFEAAGMNATGFASQVSPVNGQVFDLSKATDFAGTYQATAMAPDRREAVLKNEKGVALRVASLTPMRGGLESVTIRLTR